MSLRFPSSIGAIIRLENNLCKNIRQKSLRFYSANVFDGSIPLEKLVISHGPSMTAGGMNAEEASRPIRAEVKFHVSQCDWIPSSVREKLFEKYKHRIDKNGYFVVRSERTASGSLNVADCLDKLRFSIHEAAEAEHSRTKTLLEEIDEQRTKKELEAKKKLQMKKAAV